MLTSVKGKATGWAICAKVAETVTAPAGIVKAYVPLPVSRQVRLLLPLVAVSFSSLKFWLGLTVRVTLVPSVALCLSAVTVPFSAERTVMG